MEFVHTVLLEELRIESLVSLHYFEFSKDYVFEGEKHDFWEFLYVAKGEVEVLADHEGYKLQQGDIIFHKPGEFHSVWANKKISPSLIVISFVCRSHHMRFFENRILKMGEAEVSILKQIINQGLLIFEPPFNDPSYHTLTRRNSTPAGGEQLIKINLELLLLNILNRNMVQTGNRILSIAVRERSPINIVKRITSYMVQNVDKPLTLEDFCVKFNMSQTHISTIFREQMGYSLMKYFKKLKIDYAKQLISESHYNLTEIAEKLNYNSIHGFSRHFKSVLGVSPSEFVRLNKV